MSDTDITPTEVDLTSPEMPLTLPNTIFSSKTYHVVIGILPDWKQDVYLVKNKVHGVVEFAHPILLYVRQWIRDQEEQILAWEIVEAQPPQAKPAQEQTDMFSPLDPKHYQ